MYSCDGCAFCEQDEYGIPVKCLKGNKEAFGDGIGYCDEFEHAEPESE